MTANTTGVARNYWLLAEHETRTKLIAIVKPIEKNRFLKYSNI